MLTPHELELLSRIALALEKLASTVANGAVKCEEQTLARVDKAEHEAAHREHLRRAGEPV